MAKKKNEYDDVFLPDEQEISSVKLEEMVWLLYGQPGIGKTTFASKMGKPLFLCTLPGQKYIKAFTRPVTSWVMFKKYVDMLEDETPEQYTTIVIDTVDQLYTHCKKYIYKKRNIEHVSDEEWGKGYEIVADEFNTYINKLTLLPYGVVFISHEKVIDKRGRIIKTSKIIPSLAKQAQAVINPITDVIGYCGFKEEVDEGDRTRYILFDPSETIEAKDWTGKLPKKCRLDYETVENFLLKNTGTKVTENKQFTKKKKRS